MVRVNLHGSGEIASATMSGLLGSPLMAEGRLWVVGTPSTTVTGRLLYELSPTTLKIERMFHIASQFVAAAAGRLWVASADGVAAISPGKGEMGATRIEGMPARATVFGLAGAESRLYLYIQGGNAGFAGDLLRCVPGVGLTGEVSAAGYVQSLVGVADGVLWCSRQVRWCMNCGRTRQPRWSPAENGFSDAGPNGTWVSQLSPSPAGSIMLAGLPVPVHGRARCSAL